MLSVLRWMYGHISDLCSESNKQRFTCNGSKVVYNASIIWGSVGPQRMFQAGQMYNSLMYFFIIGVSKARKYAASTHVLTVAARGHRVGLSCIS